MEATAVCKPDRLADRTKDRQDERLVVEPSIISCSRLRERPHAAHFVRARVVKELLGEAEPVTNRMAYSGFSLINNAPFPREELLTSRNAQMIESVLVWHPSKLLDRLGRGSGVLYC